MQTIVRAMIFIGGVLWGEYLPAQPPAPWTQLMFVEYVDQSTGNGVGLEIYNPSGTAVDLAADGISIRFFNHTTTCTSACPSSSEELLSGQIPSGGTYIVGNTAYCNSCPDSCDLAFSLNGVNGNDAVLLTRQDTAIDMIGIPCFCIGPNGTSYMVDSVDDALFQHNIARCIDNTTHYLDSNGVYVFGNDTTSWPNDRTTNVQGWAVSTDQCITRGHNESCIILPISSLYVESKVEECKTLLSWPAAEADSFQITKWGEAGAEMIRAGVVHPHPEESQHHFQINLRGKEQATYQIIAWLDGERTIESDLVNVEGPKGNCMPEAASLYPIPASDELFIQLPEASRLNIKIYDSRGQLAFQSEPGMVQREHVLSMRGLSEGIYFYRIVHEKNQPQTGKLLIHREE